MSLQYCIIGLIDIVNVFNWELLVTEFAGTAHSICEEICCSLAVNGNMDPRHLDEMPRHSHKSYTPSRSKLSALDRTS